jgi:hypothetical protein
MQCIMVSDLRQNEHLICSVAKEVRGVIEVRLGESGTCAITVGE